LGSVWWFVWISADRLNFLYYLCPSL
jgi:hypothetical protein